MIPAGQAFQLEAGTPLELHMRDGTRIRGRYLGRTLIDGPTYAHRYEAAFDSARVAPFALGETLSIVLGDHRTWSLPFAGFAERALLFDDPYREEPLRVPFEYARELRRASGGIIDLPSLTNDFRRGVLPSAEALVVETLLPVGDDAQRWVNAVRVPVEDIRTAMVSLPGGTNVAGAVALGAIVAVVLFVALVAIAANQRPRSSGCTTTSTVPPTLWSARTTRAFDMERRCFEGDVLIADAWPGSGSIEPSMAMSSP